MNLVDINNLHQYIHEKIINDGLNVETSSGKLHFNHAAIKFGMNADLFDKNTIEKFLQEISTENKGRNLSIQILSKNVTELNALTSKGFPDEFASGEISVLKIPDLVNVLMLLRGGFRYNNNF